MKLFGTDGIRGEANVLLTPELAYKIGSFLGGYLKDNKIMLAMDTRRSGPVLLSSLVAGILSRGGDAYVLGVAPTPALAYLCKKHGYDYGIMISASHNPFKDNGIKIFDTNGFKISADLEGLIEDYVLGNEVLPLKKAGEIGRNYESGHLLHEYVNYIRALYDNSAKFNLLIDAANGSATSVIKDIVRGFKIRADIINNEPDGININEQCGSTHIERLQTMIKEKNGYYDLGVAFDGDADRVLFVGKDGELLDGDHVIYLLAKYLKKHHLLAENKVVVTVMANYGLFTALEALGVDTVITSVGDKYIQREIVKNNYSVGGEQSGHTIFNDFIKTGDGLYTFFKVLAILSAEKESFSAYVSEFQKYPQKLINVRVNDKEKILNNPELKTYFDDINQTLSGHGRLLVRASGTENLIRVMVEAPTTQEADELATTVSEHILSQQ